MRHHPDVNIVYIGYKPGIWCSSPSNKCNVHRVLLDSNSSNVFSCCPRHTIVTDNENTCPTRGSLMYMCLIAPHGSDTIVIMRCHINQVVESCHCARDLDVLINSVLTWVFWIDVDVRVEQRVDRRGDREVLETLVLSITTCTTLVSWRHWSLDDIGVY